MKNIGIIPNLLKDIELEMTKQVVAWLHAHHVEIYVAEHIGELLEESCHIVEEKDLFENCDVIIAIGGDGTILNVAQKACVTHTPIVGINLGRMGFLADVESAEMEIRLSKLIAGEYTIENRMMLSVKIIGPSGDVQYFHALNDISVTRGNSSRITEFELEVNEKFVDFYAADGIVVATPTGSTGYSLSAGGPIVSPTAQTIILTPICPHTIYSRSIIVSDTDKIKIKTYNHNGTQLELAADGQTKVYITPGHSIEIEKADYMTQLIKLSEYDFFEILRKKIVERRK